MERHQLSDMTVFVEVARAKGFRAAATALNLGPGSVSEAVQRFEDRLGVRLFDRSTRSVALTPAGERLYERCLPAIVDLESAVRDLDDKKDAIAGTLRLNAPRSAGPFFLNALLARFAVAYPDVDVDVIYDDSKVNLVTAGIDAAIRSSTLLEQDTHAIPIGPDLTMAVVAAPAYLKRRGVPASPRALVDHDGLCFAFGRSGQLAPWNFEGPDGVYAVTPKPRIVTNDLPTLLQFAEQGLGLAYVYAQTAKSLIDDGHLVTVLDGQASGLPRYSLNFQSKRHMPARLRAFIDLVKARA